MAVRGTSLLLSFALQVLNRVDYVAHAALPTGEQLHVLLIKLGYFWVVRQLSSALQLRHPSQLPLELIENFGEVLCLQLEGFLGHSNLLTDILHILHMLLIL